MNSNESNYVKDGGPSVAESVRIQSCGHSISPIGELPACVLYSHDPQVTVPGLKEDK